MASLFEDLGARLFGFKVVPKEREPDPVSFAPEVKDDGAVVVAAGGTYGTYLDLEQTVRSESELVTRYREMSQKPKVSAAIEDIVNEALVMDDEFIVRINVDKLAVDDQIKDRIREEFEEILDLLNFDSDAFEIFKRWYVDGRIYYHAIVDEQAPEQGIKELRYIDPRKIRKVREISQETDRNGVAIKKTMNEYFMYNDRGFPVGSAGTQTSNYGATTGLRIAVDSILHVTSGIMDTTNTLVLSHLHQAIKPLNQLTTLEDATVIYRISRAPERRIFYVDVGNLPKAKAEQYVRDMMVRHKNKMVYDAVTGEVRDDRKFTTMLEDYWLPRREGGKGTEIDVLPAGQNLGELTDVNYFLKQVMESLNVPISRLQPDTGFALGRSSEISRDEIKFSKFVDRIRRRFCTIFLKSLEKNLVLKGVCTKAEWTDFARHVTFDFQEDNHFAELKDSEILANRIQLAMQLEPYLGKYYSYDWFRKNVLRQNDDDIERMDEQIAEEKNDPRYKDISQQFMSQQNAMSGFGTDEDGNPIPIEEPPPDFDGAHFHLGSSDDMDNPPLNGIGDTGKPMPGDASSLPKSKSALNKFGPKK